MSPAKVILEKNSFIVLENKELHNVSGFDSLQQQERQDLQYTCIVGLLDGYAISTDDNMAEAVTEQSIFPMNRPPGIGATWQFQDGKPILILSMGTRIEPIKGEPTSDQKPSMREK